MPVCLNNFSFIVCCMQAYHLTTVKKIRNAECLFFVVTKLLILADFWATNEERTHFIFKTHWNFKMCTN